MLWRRHRIWRSSDRDWLFGMCRKCSIFPLNSASDSLMNELSNMNFNRENGRKFLLACALSASLALPALSLKQASASETKDLAPLPLQLPGPTAKGTPDNLPEGPHVEKFSDKPRPP